MKFPESVKYNFPKGSPSMRREWIEIHVVIIQLDFLESPSMRREWIEISPAPIIRQFVKTSPSMRREWIEIRYTRRPEE